MAIQLPRYFTGRSMTRPRWALAVSLAFLAAAGAAFLSRGGSQAAQKESPAAAPDPHPVVVAAVEPAKPTEPVTPREAQKPIAAPPVKSTEDRTRLLEALGTLTSSHYFQTYLNIGFIADGKTRGTYTDRDARKVLDSVLSLVNSTERQLESLEKIDLSTGDRARLVELQAVSALLRQQGKELQTYWDSGKDENAARYESLRQTAWTSILKLMGSDK
jgi:hypothetical protein